MVTAPDISVVIPARNAAATLGEQLEALARQSDGPFEVLVVDNASSDGTADVARSFADRLPITVITEPRPGTNWARNAGIEAAAGSRILLCDADDVVSEHWVAQLIAPLEDGHWVAGRMDDIALNDERTRRMRLRVEPSTGSALPVGTYGGNCGFTKADWALVGRFDERLSGWGDETEFFFRMQCSGMHSVFVEDAVVHYRLRRGMRAWIRDNYRGGRSHGRLLAYGAMRDVIRTWTTPVMVAQMLVHAALLMVDGWRLDGRSRRLGAIAYRLGRLSEQRDRRAAREVRPSPLSRAESADKHVA